MITTLFMKYMYVWLDIDRARIYRQLRANGWSVIHDAGGSLLTPLSSEMFTLIMFWRHMCNKPLFEPVGPRVITHTWVNRLRWVKAHGYKTIAKHHDVIKYEDKPPVTSGFPSQWPVTRSFDVLFLSAPKQTVEQTLETPVICDAIALILTSL